MPLIFQQDNDLGFFAHSDPEAAESQLRQLRELLAEEDRQPPNHKKIVRGLKSMISKDPLFLRGYALAGQILHDLEDEPEAAKMFEQGCRIALDLMPPDFAGPLDAQSPEVQFFLRCHTGRVEALLEKRDYPAALAASRRQLSFDPEDMFGRELELGELCILAGKPEEAEALLAAQAEDKGTAWYSLAYLSLRREDWTEAATRLRRAFLRAPYAADFLTGRMTSPNLFWDQGPNGPDFSECLFYIDGLGGELWSENQSAHEFLEWLSQTSTALAERAEMVELSEVCFGQAEPGPAAREAYDNLWRSVDEPSSAELVQDLPAPESGRPTAPWRLLAQHHERLNHDHDHGEGCGCGCGHDD